MRRIIHHLRKQPESVKRHILHASVVVAGVLLFSAWVYSLGTNFGDSNVAESVKKDLAPLSVLKSNLALPQW